MAQVSHLPTPAEAVAHLATHEPQWLLPLRAALSLADRGVQPFAGSHVLDEVARSGDGPTWIPNLRRLVTLGLIQPDGAATRGGSRRYYVIPHADQIRTALAAIDALPVAPLRLSFTALGDGPPDLATRSASILRAHFPDD